MDGKGAWRDNVFVERLWRSVKYEEVYLRAYDSVSEARASIGRYLNFYNGQRPHSSLDGVTPDQAYFKSRPTYRARETALPRISGGKAAGSQRLFRRRQETGIAQDCVVELGGLEPAAERLWARMTTAVT
jgi:Integrase core domain